MEIVKNIIGEQNATITVKIAQSDYEPEVDKQLKKVRQKAELKGFRQGMAPMSIIKKMYGSSILVDELNKILSDALTGFMEKETDRFIGEPIPYENEKEVSGDENNFEFVYEAGYYPELTLELNKRIKVPFYNISPDSAETDKEVDYYRRRFGKLENVDTVGKDDMVKAIVLDLPGEDGEVRQKEVDFMPNMIPEDQQKSVVGLKVDGTVELEVRKAFPNDVDLCNMLGVKKEDLDTLPERLSFRISNVSQLVNAELNQEFFDKVCGDDKVHSEEEFRNYIEDQAKKYYAKLSLSRLAVDGRKALLKKADIQMPEAFVKRLLMYLNRDNEKVTEESIDKDMENIIENLRWTYIMDTLLEKNEIKIESTEIEAEARATVEGRLRQYGIYDFSSFNIGDLVNHTLQNKSELANIMDKLKTDKIAELLKEKIKLDEKEISIEEYNKLYTDEYKEFEEENEEK